MGTRTPQDSTAGATSSRTRRGPRTARDGGPDKRRTPAQYYCLVAGSALLLAGILGFIADSTFDLSTTGTDAEGGNADGELQGDSFLGFEVNGWHNLVHLVSGLALLAAAGLRTSAKAVALTFGVVYGLVTLIGLVDGNDVLGVIPVNPADNVLHVLLSALGIATGLVSRPKARDPQDRSHPESGPRTVLGHNEPPSRS